MNLNEIVIESSPFLRCLMTASWIAREVGVKQVNVKYTLVETLSVIAGLHEDPMPHLEFIKADCEFQKMKELSPKFSKEEWFPQEVEISEQKQNENFKEESFRMYPESEEH